MAINLDNRVIHRFIQDISAYESGGEFYSQIIPLDTQAYAIYTDENGHHLCYVIGDGDHTYVELRNGQGNNEIYKEYLVVTQEKIEDLIATLQQEIEERKDADHGLQQSIDINSQAIVSLKTDVRDLEDSLDSEIQTREQFDTLLDEAIADEISNREIAIDNLSLELNSKINSHIDNKENPHQVTKEQIGLGNVDNTSDLNKPISTAVQAALNNKQDNLTQSQLDAVNSGITSGIVAQVGINKTNIENVQHLIPNTATSENPLVDKNFVNSSIARESATFRGTYNSVNELPTQNIDNNDYAYVISTDELGNKAYNEYKYNGEQWLYEFTLNNSSFTAEQWAAINSGATTNVINQIAINQNAINTINTSDVMLSNITSSKVSAYDSHIIDSTIHVTANEKQTWDNKQDILTAGTGIDITNNVISATGGIAQWGNITGTLSDQTDLQSALDDKISHYSQMPVASSENNNEIVQYIGQTDSNYTNGYFYKNNSETVDNSWVHFEPTGEDCTTQVTVSLDNFKTLLTEYCEGRSFTAEEIVSGNFGYHNITSIYSFSADTADGRFFSLSVEISKLQELGFVFDPWLGPRQGVHFTCNLNSQTTTYSWQQINVQPSSGSSEAVWGNITGTLSNQTDLQNALNTKQDVISDLSNIRTGASLGETSIQPNDNISSLTNDAEYITKNVDNLTNYTTTSDLNTALNGKVSQSSSASVVYGTDAQGAQTTYAVNSFGAVDDVQVNGTSIVSNKTASLTVDNVVTENSTNLVTSGAVYSATPSIILRDWSINNNE